MPSEGERRLVGKLASALLSDMNKTPVFFNTGTLWAGAHARAHGWEGRWNAQRDHFHHRRDGIPFRARCGGWSEARGAAQACWHEYACVCSCWAGSRVALHGPGIGRLIGCRDVEYHEKKAVFSFSPPARRRYERPSSLSICAGSAGARALVCAYGSIHPCLGRLAHPLAGCHKRKTRMRGCAVCPFR